MSATDPVYFLVKLPAPDRVTEVRAKQCKNKALAEQLAAVWIGQILDSEEGRAWKDNGGDIAVCLFVSSVAPKRLTLVKDDKTE